MSIDLFTRDKWLRDRDVAELFVCHDDGGYSSDDDAAMAYAQTFTTPTINVTPDTAPGNAWGWGSLSDPAGGLGGVGGIGGGGGGGGGGDFGPPPSFDPAALYATGYPLGDVANFGRFGFGRPWSGPGVGSYPFGPHGEYGPAATSVWQTAQPTQAYRGADLGRYDTLPALDRAHLAVDPALINALINPRNQSNLAGGIGAANFHGLTASRGPSVGGHADFDLAFNPNASTLAAVPLAAYTRGADLPELAGVPVSSLAALTLPARTPPMQTQSAQTAARNMGRSSPEQTDVVPPPEEPAIVWTPPNTRGATPPPPGTPTQTPQPQYTPPPPPIGLEAMLQASGQQMSDFLRMNPELMRQQTAGLGYVGSMYHGLMNTPAAFNHLAEMGLGPSDVAMEMQRAFTNIGLPANVTPEDANFNFQLHYGASPDTYAQSLMHSYGLSLPPIVAAQGSAPGGGGGGDVASSPLAGEWDNWVNPTGPAGGSPQPTRGDQQMGALARGPWSV